MELRPIPRHSADAAQASRLNNRAFPACERVPFDAMYDSLDTEILGVYDGAALHGFIILRRCFGMAYVCFFAVEEASRCRGVGAQALRLLQAYAPDCRLVVDYEAPDDAAPNNAQRLRRQAFYRRCGLAPTGWYAYYSDTEFEIACAAPDFDPAAFRAMFDRIHAAYPDFDPKVYAK